MQRRLIGGLLSAALLGCAPAATPYRHDGAALAPISVVDRAVAALAALEVSSGGRLGVMVLRADGTPVIAHRGDERFAMCSSFKLPLAALVLAEVDAERIAADQMLVFERANMSGYSPSMTALLQGDVGHTTVIVAAKASVMTSDNTAANLLLMTLDGDPLFSDGPVAFTQGMRAWGDSVTRIDRYETALNENLVGDPRDTTTPVAMASTLRGIFYSDRLSVASRARLRAWTIATTTGSARVRAGLPVGWVAGDKTGTCANAGQPNPQFNDIGWVETPGGGRYLFVVMLDRPTVEFDAAQAVLADAARAVVPLLR